MKKTIPAVSEWKRIFIDTSFIIDSVRNQEKIKEDDAKYHNIRNTHLLLDYFKQKSNQDQQVRWVTSSIVLSELTKFENEDAVSELQRILDSSELEIINFTKKEANFILKDMVNYVEQKHVSQYIKALEKALKEDNIFNPKNYVAKDALIIACAKSKRCDVVLTSDKNSFIPIAKQVGLPILNTADLLLDMFKNLNYNSPISTDY